MRLQGPYFEGWYFKHRQGGRTAAFIPGYQIDRQGNGSAFIQVITDGWSGWAAFPLAELTLCRSPLCVRVSGSVFTERGMAVDFTADGVRVRGAVRYGPLTPPKGDVMGPFRVLPAMECRHGVVSLHHRLSGGVRVGGEILRLDGGAGYIETDRGRSFPKPYLWTQCSDFPSAGRAPCSIMVTAARIPYLGAEFPGCIASIYRDGRELRLATYHGAKVAHCGPDGLLLRQGRWTLRVDIPEQYGGRTLRAPMNGGMSRRIRESAACPARYRLYRDGNTVFDWRSNGASAEYEG